MMRILVVSVASFATGVLLVYFVVWLLVKFFSRSREETLKTMWFAFWGGWIVYEAKIIGLW